MYWLYKYNPISKEYYSFCGDSGGMSLCVWVEGGDIKYEDGIPTVGKHIRVGSIYARTMQSQDWWQTNKIVEILEDTKTDDEHFIRFKTKSGSEYHWKQTL